MTVKFDYVDEENIETRILQLLEELNSKLKEENPAQDKFRVETTSRHM